MTITQARNPRRNLVRKGAIAALIAGVMVAAVAAPASAHHKPKHWKHGHHGPDVVYVQPAPVYVQPQPVYVQPAPVYVAPQPVYVAPPPPPVYTKPSIDIVFPIHIE